ncbi:NAD/NADP octopine/nopaline dehydrogenase family protein [Alphaproteobacteria bacterium]|nr:NAD/NADP octopine/nopaline dehydrogenase family protein [Alphaproteobacteria bacterium]
MSGGFEDFAAAFSASRVSADSIQALSLNKVAVLGGGGDARLLAALCLSEGAEVKLFSAYGKELEALRSGGGVALRGAGPVGSYQVDQDSAPSIKTTAELDSAVVDADVIFLTGPVHKQRTYAMVLADHLRDGQVLVLAPGRSMGALEVNHFLRVGGATADVTIVEAVGLPYWFEEVGTALHLSEAGQVPAATLPAGRVNVIEALQRFLPNIRPVLSIMQSGFSDGSGMVEIPALILGGVAMEDGARPVPMGGTPLPENQTFRALIGPEQATVIATLSEERRAVASRFGVRDLPSAEAWTNCRAGSLKGDGSRPVPSKSESKALLRDGVAGSLVPLVSAAKLAKIPVPVTEAMIALVSSILGADIAPTGRRLETIGIVANDADEARAILDTISKGGK